MSGIILATFLVVGGGRPSADRPAPGPGLPPEVFRHWVHSYADDTDALKVFRPKGYKFPPARGRVGFEIEEGGEFLYYDIAPADGSMKIPGRWEARGEDTLVVTFPGGREPMTIRIVSCTGDMLKIRK